MLTTLSALIIRHKISIQYTNNVSGQEKEFIMIAAIRFPTIIIQGCPTPN